MSKGFFAPLTVAVLMGVAGAIGDLIVTASGVGDNQNHERKRMVLGLIGVESDCDAEADTALSRSRY